MFNAGYRHCWNTDLSPVVIEQQRKCFPDQRWDVMDARDTGIDNNTVKSIVDKSLIDTLMCCSSSHEEIHKWLLETHRILQSNGIFICFSLHRIDEIKKYFNKECFNWNVSMFRLKSSRWDEGKNRRTSVAHSLVVCRKVDVSTGEIPESLPPLILPTTLTEEDEEELTKMAQKVIERVAFEQASLEKIVSLFDVALTKYSTSTSVVEGTELD